MSSARILGIARLRVMLALLVSMCIGHAEPARAIIDVWVDPGHGNKDTGTPGIDGPSPPNEADLTMPTASWLYDWLSGFGYIAALTRNSEANNSAIHLKPRARLRILNGLDPNDENPPFRDSSRIIISIHMDAACNKKGVCDSTQHKTTVYFNPDSAGVDSPISRFSAPGATPGPFAVNTDQYLRDTRTQEARTSLSDRHDASGPTRPR